MSSLRSSHRVSGLATVALTTAGIRDWQRFGIVFVGAALMAFGFVGLRSKENTAARGVARILVGGLAVAGIAVVVGMVVALAFVVYIFIVCTGFKI